MEKRINEVINFHNDTHRWKVSLKYASDIHHIFTQWMGWTNHPDNKVKLYRPFHEARHRVTGNQLIKPSLLQILQFSWSAFTDEFVRDYKHLLSEDDLSYYYKEHVFRR